MNTHWTARIALACLIGAAAYPTAAGAEDSGAKQPEPPPVISDPSKSPMPTAKELETEITELQAPLDQEQMGMLFYNVSRVQDPAEREQLRKLLNDRMTELMKVPSTISAAPTDEELKKRIETVNLNPNAPAEDVKARQDLVAAIMNLPDPERRDRMLKELEWRELGAHTAVYGPKSTKSAPPARP